MKAFLHELFEQNIGKFKGFEKEDHSILMEIVESLIMDLGKQDFEVTAYAFMDFISKQKEFDQMLIYLQLV